VGFGRTCGRARPIEVRDDDTIGTASARASLRELKDFSAVHHAQGPAVRHGVRLLDVPPRVRRARGRAHLQPPARIRDHNEKLAIAKFREFIAPTLVTRDMASSRSSSTTRRTSS
jgi:glutathione synthase